MDPSGEVNSKVLGEHLGQFTQDTAGLSAAIDFLRTAPVPIQTRARDLDPRRPLLSWARRQRGGAWEGLDLLATILRHVDHIIAPFAGPFAELDDFVAHLDSAAESTRDWLLQRREEHATWVPNLTDWLVQLADGARLVLQEALTALEQRRFAATVEAVAVESALGSTLVRAASRRLEDLSPEEFELLVADCLDAMGLVPTRVGNVRAPDGGIDIIAIPRGSVFPFLLAVQVKHHAAPHKTGVHDVRSFVGAVQLHSLLSAGMMVTNTSFTPDAHWVAKHATKLVQLYGQSDLRSWIKGEFLRSVVWRDIPTRIQLGRGIEIVVPRPDDLTHADSAVETT
jgi:HJR/Mrr/RecB family endonuclease